MDRQWSKVQGNSHTSVAELREFLGRMRNRSPQEVLGVLAASQLLNSTLLAAAGFVVLLILTTVIPFALRGAAPEPVAKQEPAAAAAEVPTAGDSANALPADDANGPPKTDADRAVDAMGIGETKSADPKKNPLEGSLDDLLDGID